MPASMKKTFTLYTAEQAARRRGVTVERWYEIVATQPCPPLFTTGGVDQWADWQLPARPPRRKRTPQPKTQPDRTAGMWTLGQAARHTGLKPGTFRAYVSRGLAPAPAARRGRHPVWRPDEVRAYAAARRLQTPPAPSTPPPPPVPDTPLWTARECASYHGVSTRTWHCAVSHGDAPQPVATTGKRIPLWSAMAVRNTTVE